MRRKYKVGLVLIAVLIIFTICVGVSKIFLGNSDKKKSEINITSVDENIKEYGYTLDNRDTRYMRDEFSNLKDILKEREIDYESYAKSLAKLFVIDFYTLNNKVNKYDVGSLEYVVENKKEEFAYKAMDTIYNNIIDNTYNDRKQVLPEITSVDIIDTEKTEFKLNEETKEAYKITMKYTYDKDLGYDKEGVIYLVKNNNKLEVASYTPSIE